MNNPTTVPATLEDAVAKLKAEVELKWAKDPNTGEPTDEDNAIGRVHHFLGMHIRNEYGLWSRSPLACHFHNRFGLAHADDMSGLIFRCLHREMNGKLWDPESIVASYKAYWEKHGGLPQWAKGTEPKEDSDE